MQAISKSKAMIQFESEIAKFEDRVGDGECRDPIGEYRRILSEALPGMSEDERRAHRELELHAHQLGAELLAERGRPVPGNDSMRPN